MGKNFSISWSVSLGGTVAREDEEGTASYIVNDGCVSCATRSLYATTLGLSVDRACKVRQQMHEK